MKKHTLTTILFTAFVIIFQVYETKAAWGDYDPSFGFGGVSVDSVTGYYPEVTALQPDGKILVTGYRTSVYGGQDFFLRRYLSNGSRDTAFGTNGEASGFGVNSLRQNRVGLNIAVLPNGKIAVAGKANGFYAVWQVTASGRNDRTFGQNGFLLLNQYPIYSHFPDINIQSGKILLTVPKVTAVSVPIALVRLNSDGTLDQTFGNVGESVTNLVAFIDGNGLIQYFGTIIERDGKITVSGHKNTGTLLYGLDRKLADGRPDLTFLPESAGGGLFCCVMMPGLVKLNNGRYQMWINNSNITFFVHEFNSLGGYERNSFGGNLNEYGRCPTIFTKQSDGKFVMSPRGVMYRLDAEISNQNAETAQCGGLDSIEGLARAVLTPDDRIVAAGRYNGSLILVRLLPN